MIARKQKVVRKLVLGIKGKLTQAGVTMVQGEAQIVDAHHVSCGEELYECDNLLLFGKYILDPDKARKPQNHVFLPFLKYIQNSFLP